MDLEEIQSLWWEDKCPADARSEERNYVQQSPLEQKPKSSEPGLPEVLAALPRLLTLLDALIVQNAHLIHQNQQMIELIMQSDPDAEPTRYLDGTSRGN